MGILLYIKIKAAVGRKKRELLVPSIANIVAHLDTFLLHGNYPCHIYRGNTVSLRVVFLSFIDEFFRVIAITGKRET
jgi:hypothetical protein